jgi:uncharacterized protein YbjT (DUF2867 family)
MSQKREILVTGGTGQQGGAIARELLARGYRVRAMTRHPESERARALEKRGAKIVRGNFDSNSSLEEALAGVWGCYSVQNTWEAGVEGEERQGKHLAELARRCGVEHFVYSSVASAHRHTGIPHFDNKWRVEETIRRLGFPSYTILRPVFFMENFLSLWFKPAIDDGHLTVGIRPSTMLQMIAVEDIGKYGAWAFDEHEKLNGRALDIAGDACTMPEAAKIIGSAAGHRVDFAPTPREEVRSFSEDFAFMLEWFDRVGYNADIVGMAKESRIRPTTLAEWVVGVDWSVRTPTAR